MNPTPHGEFELPQLRFVPVDALVPHEKHDEQRAQPLIQRMREQGVLKNPPIVSPLDAGGSRFVVLDGANRTTAARVAALPHLVVQVVDYDDESLELSTWHHALVGVEAERIRQLLDQVPGLSVSAETPLHAHALLARREAIALFDADHETLVLQGGGSLHERTELLNSVVDLYRGRARFHRVTGDTLAGARKRFPEASALVVFPSFEKAEILELATDGARLPAGITRHLIPWRALRLNVPLDRLADENRSLAEKDQWLASWLQEKVIQRRVRFYQESTVVFDE
ncbi:MAG: ParB N-terminal domain-containing protein [Candidatus Eisenbacteria bacterium]|uniref:ParB N-terminal domain-containing protein n=1 Tax=Eiseniibacteriota bacterium TaxID=2212470 RepID=A0A849SKQ8_UNCEI|nr:ParB N-terminal domain-containing protein [Candidatus Eisenbacteria bacterium]